MFHCLLLCWEVVVITITWLINRQHFWPIRHSRQTSFSITKKGSSTSFRGCWTKVLLGHKPEYGDDKYHRPERTVCPDRYSIFTQSTVLPSDVKDREEEKGPKQYWPLSLVMFPFPDSRVTTYYLVWCLPTIVANRFSTHWWNLWVKSCGHPATNIRLLKMSYWRSSLL